MDLSEHMHLPVEVQFQRFDCLFPEKMKFE